MSSYVRALPRTRRRPPRSQWLLWWRLVLALTFEQVAFAAWTTAESHDWLMLLVLVFWIPLAYVYRRNYERHKWLDDMGIAIAPPGRVQWALIIALAIFVIVVQVSL